MLPTASERHLTTRPDTATIQYVVDAESDEQDDDDDDDDDDYEDTEGDTASEMDAGQEDESILSISAGQLRQLDRMLQSEGMLRHLADCIELTQPRFPRAATRGTTKLRLHTYRERHRLRAQSSSSRATQVCMATNTLSRGPYAYAIGQLWVSLRSSRRCQSQTRCS